jgi:hypothetical protein
MNKSIFDVENQSKVFNTLQNSFKKQKKLFPKISIVRLLIE